MDFECRLKAVLEELGPQRWDLIVFSETWREEKREVFQTDSGHTWLGSGGTRRSNGVGLLLHRRWEFLSFSAVSDRICSLDVLMADYTLRIIGVYMPHGGYDDSYIDSVYTCVEELFRKDSNKLVRRVLAGDFNARVGHYLDGNADQVLEQNVRGLWLRNWCGLHGFSIANSQPSTGTVFDDLWTFRNNTVLKQLDYILLDSVLFRDLTYCYVMKEFSTGSDHRAVIASFTLLGRRRRNEVYVPPQPCGVKSISPPTSVCSRIDYVSSHHCLQIFLPKQVHLKCIWQIALQSLARWPRRRFRIQSSHP